MKKKSSSRPAFIGADGLLPLALLAAAGCLIGLGTLVASSRPEATRQASLRTLTFAERVTYQRATEQVYWRHRIWPKENAQPKPPLDAVMSPTQFEKKVQDYLLKSQLVTDQRGSPITASELQVEMDRMASHTKKSEVLGELFKALGNDPFVIAECVARPILVDRLASESTNGRDGSPSRPLSSAHGSARPAVAPYRSAVTLVANSDNAAYKLPEISVPLDCTDDTWAATTTVNAPDARECHTAVWTGSEMIVWGGVFCCPPIDFNTGGRYNPGTDGWTATSTANAPLAREDHTAVWTGNEIIVWGGYNSQAGIFLNTGGTYCAQPSTPMIQGAVSRKTHYFFGSFGVNLPLSGTPAIECRSGGATNDYTIVLSFNANVSVTGTPQAAVTSGIGTIGSGGVSNGGMVVTSGNVVTIPLTNVANAQTINVTLNNVNGSTDFVIPMSVLLGDVNGNGAVNASDVALTKSRIGQQIDATNFRSDINADGSINVSDASLVKSVAGTGLP